MKKRYVLGSAIVALLMLVSTQVVFLNIVRSSDPTAHVGDAEIGDLWISELDVSSVLTTIDFIGIGHANAADDWVIWEDGIGNINASWEVDIEAIHPEYYVLLGIVIYNVDENCIEMGNDSFSKTYGAGNSYNESGTLTVALEFTQEQMQQGSQTLVCYMSACVMINDTSEAKNFTSWAHDRCIIAVDFSDPAGQPLFPSYRAEANQNFPHIWSYLDGWEESGRFASEDDMLENQTFFTDGGNINSPSYSWKIGEFHIHCYLGGTVQGYFAEMNHIRHMKYDKDDTLDVESYATITYYDHGAIFPATISRYYLTHEGVGSTWSRTYVTDRAFAPADEVGVDFEIDKEDDIGSNNKIYLWGDAWAFRPIGVIWEHLDGYQIKIDEGTDPSHTIDVLNGYYWEESCAYFDYNQALGVSSITEASITTVTVDISNVLGSDDQFFYTFAGNVGDERIQVTC
ncbi:MAG: hypothetical protein JSW60_03720 [Thermoplasmatales archaeon]|nr:MAG: hypothetical protein JSW60_03720 [Thermoplasmatales archaeon]